MELAALSPLERQRRNNGGWRTIPEAILLGKNLSSSLKDYSFHVTKRYKVDEKFSGILDVAIIWMFTIEEDMRFDNKLCL